MRKFYVQFDWQDHCVLCKVVSKVVRVGQSSTSAEFGHDDPFDLDVP